MKRSAKQVPEGPLWTLQELSQLVEQALAVGYEPPRNGQVRAVPGERTIRFYTTLGLLSRPAEMRGRTAYYGRRHLLELVAVKRLQGLGLALGEVQQQLYGLDDDRLAAIARLPELPAPPECPPPTAGPGPDRRETAFWEAEPAPVPGPGPLPCPDLDEPVQGLYLDERVLLVLRGGAQLGPEDREALRQAAGPLLELLRQRGLLPPA